MNTEDKWDRGSWLWAWVGGCLLNLYLGIGILSVSCWILRDPSSGVRWHCFWGTQGASQASPVSLPEQMGHQCYIDSSLAAVLEVGLP